MNSEELTTAVESCNLAPSDFSHERHVQLAWHYLRQMPRDEAVQRFADSLRRYVGHVGAESKFQLTLTVALVRLIAARGPESARHWEEFRKQHPELFGHWRGLLDRHYSAQALERGRSVFVEADREPLP